MSTRRTRDRLLSPRRRLYVRPFSGRRSTSRSRRGASRRPIPIRAHPVEAVPVEPTPHVIDLTVNDSLTCNDDAVVDLTSPMASNSDLTSPRASVASNSGVNDTSVVVIGRSESRRPDDLPSRTLILSSDDSDDDLPSLDIPKMTTPKPAAPLSNTNASPGENPPMLQCPICMDDYKEIRLRGVHLSSTVCGHIFCTDCIKSAVTQHGQCPLCRAKLRHKGYHTLHL